MPARAAPILLALLGLSALPPGVGTGDPDSLPPNTLTAAEVAEGWQLLFDGRTTQGWHSFRELAARPEWQVVDGALTLVEGGGGDLMSDGIYGDFELVLEWRISRHGNSGIFYRVLDEGPYVFVNGPEYQLLDNRDAPEPPVERAGAVFALYAPAVDAVRPVGEFNETRIRIEEGRVEHWLNGVKLLEYRLDSPDFAARVAASKFHGSGSLARWTARFGTIRRGNIALQDHGHLVAFRNVRIKALN